MAQGINHPQGGPAPRRSGHTAGATSIEGQVGKPEESPRTETWTSTGAYPKTQVPNQTEGSTPRGTSPDWEGGVKPAPTESLKPPRSTQRDPDIERIPRF